jgi:triacylglycerol lipase
VRLLATFPRRQLPPIWREGLTGVELAALWRDPLFRRADPSVGGGRSVLLIPGFLVGDDSLALMARWLRRNGYRPSGAGIRANVQCATVTLDALEARLEAQRGEGDERVGVVGHSYGGTLARSLAMRRPDLVSGIVTLGAALVDQLAIHPLARVPVRLVGRLGSLGTPGLLREECLNGVCCTEVWHSPTRPFPPEVGFVSLYSRSDGLVDWRACLDPRAEAVEVRASHIGMAVNASVYRAVDTALRAFAAAGALASTAT